MAIKTFTDNTSLPASDINSFLANSAMTYIGAYTATATTLFIDGCFTSTYENYLCTFQSTNVTTTGTLNWRVRASASPLTSAYRWGSTAYYYDAGSAFGYSSASAAGVPLAVCSGGSYGAGSLLIMNPQISGRKTTTIADGASDYSNYIGFNVRGHINNTNSYDGIQVYQDAGGTITGTLRVYGVRQA
jgi:hypothetical protein